MKKIIFATISALIVLGTAACSNGTAANATTTNEKSAGSELETSEGSPQIVIAATGLQQDQFTNVLMNGYQSKADELGIKILLANSQLSPDKESEMINNFLEAGVQGIIIEPVNPDASAAMAELAAARGIPVFACAIPINSDVIFASSINDNYDLGTSTGQGALKFLEKTFGKEQEIKCAILAYDSADPTGSQGRISGFQDQVTEFNFNYVARQDVTTDNAYQVVTDIITANPDLNLIYSASENGLIGSYNAIKAAGKEGQIFVVGVDCSAQICDMMLDDTNIIQVTTAQAPYEQGEYAVQTVYDYIVSGKEPEEAHLKLEGILVTREDENGIKEFKENWENRSK